MFQGDVKKLGCVEFSNVVSDKGKTNLLAFSRKMNLKIHTHVLKTRFFFYKKNNFPPNYSLYNAS